MVLHNDKWKYKARRNYMHKHGLQTLQTDREKKRLADSEAEARTGESAKGGDPGNLTDGSKEENENTAIEGSGNESEGSSGEEGERRHRHRKLRSNSWRFESDVKDDDELMKDPDLVELERKKEQEEREYYEDQKDLVMKHLKIQGDDDEAYRGVSKGTRRKVEKKLTTEDLIGWSIDGDELGVEEKPEEDKHDATPKSSVRALTSDEARKFHEYRKEIEHRKMVDAAKGMSPEENKKKGGKRTIELDLATDAEKYKDIVDARLNETIRESEIQGTEGDLEDNLSELLGEMGVSRGSLRKTSERKPAEAFDLDKLIGASKQKEPETKPEKKLVARKSSLPADDDEFLNDILG